MKNKVKRKKYRIKYQSFIVFFLLAYLFFSIMFKIFDTNISNIYIINNSFLSDQQIIEIADLDNYPNTFRNSSKKIKKKLEENCYIQNATVYKKKFKEVYIEVLENRPLFYNLSNSKTLLLDGTMVDEQFNSPVLINYVPDTIYEKFIESIKNISVDVLERISEIEYDPNSVDNERFILSMIDDNYVYLTLYKFDKLNNYIDIIKKFENKKGILYLDSGEYFKVIGE